MRMVAGQVCDSERDDRSDPVEQRGAVAAIRDGLANESFETTAASSRTLPLVVGPLPEAGATGRIASLLAGELRH
jgi:hypothetical protein